MNRLTPHQQRVIIEKDELYLKLGRLEVFMAGVIYGQLDEAEQDRLKRQHDAMETYLKILQERIEAWG